jgi:hypothetical protein
MEENIKYVLETEDIKMWTELKKRLQPCWVRRRAVWQDGTKLVPDRFQWWFVHKVSKMTIISR